MDAVMERPQHVATETHVERQLIEANQVESVYEYRLTWEGTVIASTRVMVSHGAPESEIDQLGVTFLFRAATSCAA